MLTEWHSLPPIAVHDISPLCMAESHPDCGGLSNEPPQPWRACPARTLPEGAITADMYLSTRLDHVLGLLLRPALMCVPALMCPALVRERSSPTDSACYMCGVLCYSGSPVMLRIVELACAPCYTCPSPSLLC